MEGRRLKPPKSKWSPPPKNIERTSVNALEALLKEHQSIADAVPTGMRKRDGARQRISALSLIGLLRRGTSVYLLNRYTESAPMKRF